MATQKPAPKPVNHKLHYATEIGGVMEPAGKTVPLYPDQVERVKAAHATRQTAETQAIKEA